MSALARWSKCSARRTPSNPQSSLCIPPILISLPESLTNPSKFSTCEKWQIRAKKFCTMLGQSLPWLLNFLHPMADDFSSPQNPLTSKKIHTVLSSHSFRFLSLFSKQSLFYFCTFKNPISKTSKHSWFFLFLFNFYHRSIYNSARVINVDGRAHCEDENFRG